jgi:hypothetical protein
MLGIEEDAQIVESRVGFRRLHGEDLYTSGGHCLVAGIVQEVTTDNASFNVLSFGHIAPGTRRSSCGRVILAEEWQTFCGRPPH